jgi:DNA-binding GntR family transcriptional regulator
MEVAREQSQVEIAYQAVRELIRRRELAPGYLLSEGQLASHLGMSRTPVHEAIARLSHEGLVTTLPKRGTIVNTLSVGELDDLYSIREVLEGLAARLAAARINAGAVAALSRTLELAADALSKGHVEALARLDVAFHNGIAQAGANRRLERLLGQIRDVAVLDELRARMMTAPSRFTSSFNEHTSVYCAIEARQPENAEEMMRQHIRASMQWTVDYIQRHETWRPPESQP